MTKDSLMKGSLTNWPFTKGSLTKGVTPLGRCDRLPHHILNLEFQSDESRGSHNKESLPPPLLADVVEYQYIESRGSFKS